MKTVCVVTGTRADYDLLRWVMFELRSSTNFRLQIVATGTHLSQDHGYTIESIKADGFIVDRNVEMLVSSDTATGVTKSMGLGIIGFADAFDALKPNLLILLGDRYEALAAATAASIARIPIAHIHGGERSEGAYDEAFRHCITKMSHIHYVATDEYRHRVIQLGENPEMVFLVGGLGVDNILKTDLIPLAELEEDLKFKFRKKNLLVTFHPSTLDEIPVADQISQLLLALKELDDFGLIFTMPNADNGNSIIKKKIEDFCENHPSAKAYMTLGARRYLSCMKYVNGVVGNSSSGLTEAPSIKVGTINIGDRQRGRIKAKSVIDCEPTKEDITRAIRILMSREFQEILKSSKNPYGDGKASCLIKESLEKISLNKILKKKFYDL